MSTARRRLVTAALAVAAGVLAPAAVCAVGVSNATKQVYTAPPSRALPVQAPPLREHDPSKPTAVIVTGLHGTNAADTLAPFEVLAESHAFNVYTVAAEQVPVPLTGGLDLMPDLSFARLDALLGSAPPDVVVVPQLKGEDADGPVVGWLREQHAEGAPLMVSICVGAELLAQAGILDGRPATSHWLKLIALRRDFPQVEWRDDVTYVDDGDVISSAGVLNGVDATLRAVERTAGTATAQSAADAVRWPRYSPGRPATIPAVGPRPADLVSLLGAGFRWDRPRMGVLVQDGVAETALAAAFRPYTELSYLARPVALSLDGGPVRSRHGLTFVPRQALEAAAPSLDRLLVAGTTAVDDDLDRSLPPGLTPVPLPDRPGYAFDPPLRDIAAVHDVATARWVAKSLGYPLPTINPDAARWPWPLVAWPALVAVGAAGSVLAVAWALGRRRRPGRPAQQPDEPARTPEPAAP